MPRRQVPMKDVGRCEKPRGAAYRRRSGDLRMGKPAGGEPPASLAEHIGQGGEPGELKHLSTQRKRDNSPSSGERTGKSPNRKCLRLRGCRARHMRVRKQTASRMVLGKPAKEGESPVCESRLTLAGFLSTTGHANPVGSWGVHSPRLNTPGDR